MANALDYLMTQFQKAQDTAQAANLKREAEIRAITDEIIARYQPGGTFEKASLAQLGTQKTSDVGAGMQRLIASGMAGTEAAGALETGWEKSVGAPARLKLEDLMMSRLSEAQMGKAGFLERIENTGPDAGTIANLAMAAGQQPRYEGGGGGGGGGGVTPMEKYGVTQGFETPGSRTGVGVTPGSDFSKQNAAIEAYKPPDIKWENATAQPVRYSQTPEGQLPTALEMIGGSAQVNTQLTYLPAGKQGPGFYQGGKKVFDLKGNPVTATTSSFRGAGASGSW